MPSISLRGLSKRFGAEKPALDGIDLEIEAGEFACLLGPSGCGKSTILRLIAGLEYPSSGIVQLGDTVLSDFRAGRFVPPHKRGVGLVFQSFALWPHLSVAENVAFGLRRQKVRAPEREREVAAVLELLRIGRLAGRRPAELSGGEQQRVAIARALVARPSVMLLDEPMSSLDAQLRVDLRAELKRLHAQSGTTTVLVTHDQSDAMALATKVVVMRAGGIEQIGSPVQIYSEPATAYTAGFLGSPPMNLIDGSRELRAAIAGELALPEERIHTIGIRAEHVTIEAGSPGLAPGRWSLPATVEAALPMGMHWEVRLALASGGRMSAIVDDARTLPAGPVAIGFAPEHLHVFDDAGLLVGRGVSK